MNTIHLYGFEPELLVFAMSCVKSFDRDYHLTGWHNGTDFIVNGHTISCWRTETGNISARLIQ